MTPGTPLRVLLAIRSDRWFKRSMSGLQAIHQGVWLGLLRPEDIAIANAVAYATWDQYQDEDYNRSGLTDWETDVIGRHFQPGSRVMVTSAGGGREVLGLDALGYRVVGFDPSPDLIAHGQQLIAATANHSRMLQSPPDAIPPNLEGTFDAVLVGWTGYTHIRRRATRISFLRSLRALVDRDAPMLLSFFLRSPDDRTFPTARMLASGIQRIRGSREPIELGDTMAGTFDHYFAWDEIESELASGGFAVLESSNSPYPHLVGRAI